MRDITTKQIIKTRNMTREQVKELLPIIQAFAEGKTVEFLDNEGVWVDSEYLEFSRERSRYRIKPEYRPFESQEECWSEMQEHTNFGWLRRNDTGAIVHISAVFPDFILFGSEKYSYEKAFECYTFADGLPFGKREE